MRFLRWDRGGYTPGGRVHLIWISLSTHSTPAAVAEARKLHFNFFPSPTTANDLNPIETHTRSLRRLALTWSSYTDCDE